MDKIDAASSRRTDHSSMAVGALRQRYLDLTTEVLPAQATAAWPVQDDHCFQRIVLDTLFDDVWYEHVESPAYRHLSRQQSARAIELAISMVSDPARVRGLNQRNLAYRRGAERTSPDDTQRTLEDF